MIRASDFVAIVKSALYYKTVYAFGQMGSPLSDVVIMEKTPYSNMTAVKANETTRSYAARYRGARATAKTAKEGTFGFDCSGLIQAAGCEWRALADHYLGGADPGLMATRYSADDFAKSTGWNGGTMPEAEWKQIKPGCVMFQSSDGKKANHIAVYVGDGRAVEAAYDWCGSGYGMIDGVQEISLYGYQNGYMMTNRDGCTGKRKWIGYGQLPWIDYQDPQREVPEDLKKYAQDIQDELGDCYSIYDLDDDGWSSFIGYCYGIYKADAGVKVYTGELNQDNVFDQIKLSSVKEAVPTIYAEWISGGVDMVTELLDGAAQWD